MRNYKIIAVVGASDEETAHLRLLIRKAAPQLGHTWRWGSELAADFVVVDPSVFAGQMAATRAQASGVRCAILAASGTTDASYLVLHRPLKLPNVVSVLNEAAALTVSGATVTGQGDDFYFRELGDFARKGEPVQSQPAPLVDIWGVHDRSEHVPHGGIDEHIHGNPLDEPAPDPRAVKLAADTTYDATGAPSARAERRIVDKEVALHGGGVATPSIAGDAPPPLKRAPDNDRHPLKSYLEGGLLGGPSALSAPGAAMLVVDPKPRHIHVEGGLEQLEPYCRDSIARSAWRAITSAELAQVRSSAEPRPYGDLLWLEGLMQSKGRLAPHLDPGGSYRIKRRVATTPEFHQHGAIADAMVELARLNEIAANSGAPMEKVFDVVNAYDAIGELEWKPRPPRHALPEAPSKSAGLASKLRWPFGKK